MGFSPADPSILGDLEALSNHKRRVFEKMEIRLPRGGSMPYEPHEHQAKAHFPKRLLSHQMLACGRRGGKSLFDVAEALAMMAIQGTVTWIGAPTYSLTDRVFQPVYRALVIDKIFGVEPRTARNTIANRYIEMPWGSVIEGKSADRPASSKGASLDLLILDECAEHDEEYFTEYVGPGLADRQGKAIFTSTPLGLTWFHEYFKRGQDKKFQRMGWKSHRWRSEDNPHLDKDWLRQQKLVVREHVWRQEYCAEFLARSGLIWEDYVDEYFDGPNRGHLFSPDHHPIDPTWTHYRGIDIGTNHPAGCVWGAVDPQGSIWVYDEYWERKPLHEEHAQAISAKTYHGVTNTFISWEADHGGGNGGETALQIYQKAGIYCNQAPKGQEIRCDAVASYLRAALQDSATQGGLYIADSCRALRAQIKKYRHKDIKPNMDATKLRIHRKGKGDDLCDALGHLCVTKPTYTAPWFHEPMEMNLIERYGHENSVFARVERSSQGSIGIPGLGTLPRVN